MSFDFMRHLGADDKGWSLGSLGRKQKIESDSTHENLEFNLNLEFFRIEIYLASRKGQMLYSAFDKKDPSNTTGSIIGGFICDDSFFMLFFRRNFL